MNALELPKRVVTSRHTGDLNREYILTNGLGGYSASSIAGVPSRRYHGILVAALPPPYGRTIMLNHMAESVQVGSEKPIVLSHDEWSSESHEGEIRTEFMTDFVLEGGLPRWHFQLDSALVEKRILMPHLQNTVQVTYTVQKARLPVRLRLRPSFHVRHHEAPVDPSFNQAYRLTVDRDRIEIEGPKSDLSVRLYLYGPGNYGQEAAFMLDGGRFHQAYYCIEKARGYSSVDRLWCPGSLVWELREGESATVVASTEDWRTILSLSPKEAEALELERRERLLHSSRNSGHEKTLDQDESELILASDQFVVLPSYRTQDCARARAVGEDARSVIAGYHWFTDWGRDTMISLEGLTLCTGRDKEAAAILRTFSHYVRDGLIPNMFPDGSQDGLYHTADATLWFFHAVQRYLDVTGDRELLRELLPTLQKIIDHHISGTRFGIHMDAQDSLLIQGAQGYQLTWMDAKVDGWVVTPRRGKAVEINALWYNALSLLWRWMKEEDLHGFEPYRRASDVAFTSFNQRFWNPATRCLFDLVDGESGDDPAIRPNQLFAFSLSHPVLDASRWNDVFQIVEKELLTPVGLRSLSRQHPDYKMQYNGDLRTRDAAYHQGTVWGWLIGPYIDAYLKVHPEDQSGARKKLKSFMPHLSEAGIGSISEVFDADPPHTARGCPAQAWSVAEVLRCWRKTEV